MKQEESCEVCYKIRCRQCGWEPTEKEVVCIQKGEITSCPTCGWKPGERI